MKPTHDVLNDLLLLERAGEASQDTKALLEHYREHDPQDFCHGLLVSCPSGTGIKL